MMKTSLLLAVCVSLSLLVGCTPEMVNQKYMSPQQQAAGLIYILPGIQGPDGHYKHIRDGLAAAGVRCAMKIHPWGNSIPGLNLLVNETDVSGDRGWGRKIAEDILAYQQQYPGRPVFIVGQSGGSGVAVFTAEALADLGAKPINGLVLLDASVSTDYDLTKALSMCRLGIVNFYYSADTALLVAGTHLFGNVDGGHGSSAGQTPFTGHWPNLYQVRIDKRMVNPFSDPHFADTTTAFATQYIAPWILHHTWPPYFAEVQR